MKKKFLIGVAAAILLGLVVFAASPVGTDMFAIFGGGACTRWAEGKTGAGVLDMGCRKALVFYGEGTCAGKCVGIPQIPVYAREALDDFLEGYNLEVASYIYVRMMDEQKNPIHKPVSVCFKPTAVDDVVNGRVYVYDHHEKTWQSFFSYADAYGNICTTASGENSFALIGRSR
jgi:hypothetical protein